MTAERYGATVLEDLITEAFEGVDRVGGVSWSESVVIDNYGSDEERDQARKSDTDTNWQQLIDDPRIDFDRGVGGFSFLDSIGFRYYLPAAMIRYLRQGDGGWLGIVLHTEGKGKRHEFILSKLSLFTLRQLNCVAIFIEYMAHKLEEDDDPFDNWHDALAAYWHQYLDVELDAPAKKRRRLHNGPASKQRAKSNLQQLDSAGRTSEQSD